MKVAMGKGFARFLGERVLSLMVNCKWLMVNAPKEREVLRSGGSWGAGELFLVVGCAMKRG